MHLQLDDTARIETKRGAFGSDLWVCAGCVGGDQPSLHALRWRLARMEVLSLRRLFGRLGALRLRQRRAWDVRLRAVISQHVVNGSAIARPDLDRLHPLRLGKI